MKFTVAVSAVLFGGVLSWANGQSIVDIVVNSPDHEILEDLVIAAGLTEVLEGDDLTLFAPTDEAFEALPQAALERLAEPEWIFHLQDVLAYHVVSSVVYAGDLELDQSVEMFNGGIANITSLSPPMINEANIVALDIIATNGVVHVTDGVLLPPSVTMDILEIGAETESFSTLITLIELLGLDGALAGEGPFTVFAPTNEAFNALNSSMLEFLTSPDGQEVLTDILTYHVYQGIIHSTTLTSGEIMMLNGKNATVDANKATIEDANIVVPNILANNGIVHGIDSIMMPPSTGPSPAPTSTPVPAPTHGGSTPAPAPSKGTGGGKKATPSKCDPVPVPSKGESGKKGSNDRLRRELHVHPVFPTEAPVPCEGKSMPSKGKGMPSKGKGMPSKGKGMPSKGTGGGKKGDSTPSKGSGGGKKGGYYPSKGSSGGKKASSVKAPSKGGSGSEDRQRRELHAHPKVPTEAPVSSKGKGMPSKGKGMPSKGKGMPSKGSGKKGGSTPSKGSGGGKKGGSYPSKGSGAGKKASSVKAPSKGGSKGKGL